MMIKAIEEESPGQGISRDSFKRIGKRAKNNIPFSSIIDYLNQKTNSSYKPGSRRTRDLITARWHEGFQLEDFKRVIDLKTAE